MHWTRTAGSATVHSLRLGSFFWHSSSHLDEGCSLHLGSYSVCCVGPRSRSTLASKIRVDCHLIETMYLPRARLLRCRCAVRPNSNLASPFGKAVPRLLLQINPQGPRCRFPALPPSLAACVILPPMLPWDLDAPPLLLSL